MGVLTTAHVFEVFQLLGRKDGSDLFVCRLPDRAHFLVLFVIRQGSVVMQGLELVGLRLKDGKDFRLLVVGQVEFFGQHLQHPLRIHHVRVLRLFARVGWRSLVRLN